MNRSVSATATGTLDAGVGTLRSVGLCGGSDAATATIRTGGSGGTVICKLGVAANTSVQRVYVSGVAYSDLHVTVTGTSPTVDVEI